MVVQPISALIGVIALFSGGEGTGADATRFVEDDRITQKHDEYYLAQELDVVLRPGVEHVPEDVVVDMFDRMGRHVFVRPPDITAAQLLYQTIEQVERVQPVYYSNASGRDTSERDSRRVLTRRLIVRPAEGVSLPELLPGLNVASVESTPLGSNLYVFVMADDSALEAKRTLEDNGLAVARPQFEQIRIARLIPNDPLFSFQWNLLNLGQGGGVSDADLNIIDAWDSWLGASVTIGIVDDGLEVTHPEFAGRYDAASSYDFNDDDQLPVSLCSDAHGTSMAGTAAAAGNNALGTSGVAPLARLAGLRLIAEPFTDEETALALSHAPDVIDVYNNSWGPSDNGIVMEGPGPLTSASIANSIVHGRGGKGSIYVWAAGNGGTTDNVNCDGFANSRFVIPVAASTNFGTVAGYSEPGACLLVNAPSSGGSLAITTTDATGFCGASPTDYRTDAIGTSSAAAQVSGVIALMLDANPNLGWRDVQHILIRTAVRNAPGGGGWKTNAAGLSYHERYGFGRVNASAATELAETWTNVGRVLTYSASRSPNRAIPDNSLIGTSMTMAFPPRIVMEHVEVWVQIAHENRGDLELKLRSPSGMECTLLTRRPFDYLDNMDWTFMSRAFWGEESDGTWTLIARDLSAGSAGRLLHWRLTVRGTHVNLPKGDMNTNGEVTADDAADFSLAIHDPDGYRAKYPGIDPIVMGDMDADGTLNGFDIIPFLSQIKP